MAADSIFDNIAVHETSEVEIAADKMSAVLYLVEPLNGKSYTMEDVVSLLNKHGVIQGIDRDAIQKIVEDRLYRMPMTVAYGKEPVPGKPGKYTYLFRTEMNTNPKLLPDGSVDYFNTELFESVTAGQVVAKYTFATEGEDGYTVTGEQKLAKKGADLPAIRGTGFTISEDQTQYISLLNGKIELKNGRIEISNLYTVSGDLDITLGNIHFDGDVHVMGNVVSGMSIIATGNVIIDGHVQSAVIRSGHDVILKQGMQGGGTGYIECAGTVSGKFFEATKITSKNGVNANYFLNCIVNTDGRVVVSGKRGVILGGSVRSLQSITASGLGNAAEIITIVEVGINEKFTSQYDKLTKDIGKVESDVQVLRKNAFMFENVMREGKYISRTDETIYKRIKKALEIKEGELEKLFREREKMMSSISSADRAKIVVSNKVYPGVKIIVDSEVLNVTKVYTNVKFYKESGKVKVE